MTGILFISSVIFVVGWYGFKKVIEFDFDISAHLSLFNAANRIHSFYNIYLFQQH